MAKARLLRSSAALILVQLALAIDIPATPVWPSGQCTDKSLTIPSWIISDYKSSGGTTTFSVANRASGTAGSVSCASSACKVSGNAKLSASLSSSSTGALVELKESWDCSDLGQTYVQHLKAICTLRATDLDQVALRRHGQRVHLLSAVLGR
jgi:hypothetical protein